MRYMLTRGLLKQMSRTGESFVSLERLGRNCTEGGFLEAALISGSIKAVHFKLEPFAKKWGAGANNTCKAIRVKDEHGQVAINLTEENHFAMQLDGEELEFEQLTNLGRTQSVLGNETSIDRISPELFIKALPSFSVVAKYNASVNHFKPWAVTVMGAFSACLQIVCKSLPTDSVARGRAA